MKKSQYWNEVQNGCTHSRIRIAVKDNKMDKIISLLFVLISIISTIFAQDSGWWEHTTVYQIYPRDHS